MRLLELDLVRGIALITIMLNHYSLFSAELGYRSIKFPTLTSFGYSSAAELFFILSGYLVGLLYLGKDRFIPLGQIAAKFLGRSVYLLAMNCFLFVSILAISMFFTDEFRNVIGIDAVSEDPYFASYHVMRLGYHIPLLGILGFYVLMMLAAIPFSAILIKSTHVALITVVGLYIIAQLFPDVSLAGNRFGEEGLMAFNPLAWQILFLGSMVAGRHSLHKHLIVIANSKRSYAAIMITMFVVTVGYVSSKVGSGFNIVYADKQNLEIVRLTHAILIFIVLFTTATKLSFFSNTLIWRVVSTIGRHSLQCFMFGVVLSYIMAFVLSSEVSMVRYMFICVAGIISLCLFAVIFNYFKAIQKSAGI